MIVNTARLPVPVAAADTPRRGSAGNRHGDDAVPLFPGPNPESIGTLKLPERIRTARGIALLALALASASPASVSLGDEGPVDVPY